MSNQVVLGVFMLLFGFFLAAFSGFNVYSSLTNSFRPDIGSLLLPAGLALLGGIMFVAGIYFFYTLFGPNAITHVALHEQGMLLYWRNNTSQKWLFSTLSGVEVKEKEIQGGPGLAGMVTGAVLRAGATDRQKTDSYEVHDSAGKVILSINERFKDWHDLGEALLAKVGRKR